MKPPPGPYASSGRTLLAALTLGAVFLAPAVLMRTVGWPVSGGALTERISVDGVTGTRQVPGQFLLQFAGCLLWLAWAVVFVALLLELGGILRTRTPTCFGVLRPLQLFHRSRLEQVKQGGRLCWRWSQAPSLEQLLTRIDVPTFAAAPADEVPLPRGVQPAYEVTGFYTEGGIRVERETFWSIARDQLGDAGRWQQIAEVNRTLLEDNGRSVSDPGWPEEGWVLVLPGRDGD